jgi:hypothetical protein
MQVAESSWLPGVAGLRRTNENVKEPGNQCAADREDEDCVKNALKPFNDRASSEKKKDDGCFDEWQDR